MNSASRHSRLLSGLYFLQTHALFFSLLLLVASLYLFDLSRFNDFDTLPSAKQFMTPTWLPGDFYLSRPVNYRVPFNLIAGSLSYFMNLQALAIVGRLLTYALFAWGIAALVKSLGVRSRYFIPLIFVFLLKQSFAASEWMVGGFETKPLAYAFLLLALSELARKRFRRAFFFVGLTLSFHIAVGVFAIAGLVLALLVNLREMRADLRTWVKRSWPLFLSGSFGFYALIAELGKSSEKSLPGWEIYVRYRVPHHLLPSTWPANGWPLILGVLILVSVAGYLMSRHWFLRFFSAFSVFAAVFFFIGMIFSALGYDTALRYYWFRLGATLLPLSGYLLLALLVGYVVDKVPPPRFRKPIAVFFTCLSAALVLGSGFQLIRNGVAFDRQCTRHNGYAYSLDSDLYDMMGWIRHHTDRSEKFLVSPFLKEFYSVAERSMFVSFKHSPQDATQMVEWFERLKFCNRGVAPQKAGSASRAEIESNFYRLNERALLRAHTDYGVDYYLGRSRRPLALTVVKANDTYTLYRLGTSPSLAHAP